MEPSLVPRVVIPVALLCASALHTSLLAAQNVQNGPPPMPIEDAGACPFEGCIYRQWIARRVTPVYRDRDKRSRVSSSPRNQAWFASRSRGGYIQGNQTEADLAQPGDLLYLLTYQGEGYTKAWFKERYLESLYAAAFLNGICEKTPSKCPAQVLERPTQTWWVQVRNESGQVGWTDRPGQDFANKDALGATFEQESPDFGLEGPRQGR